MALPDELYENRWTMALDRLGHFLARHWLLCLNLLLGGYAVLPWLSPLARAWGWHRLGQAIFMAYRPLCHQQPAISYHLWGYQVAYCQRDAAIYTTILAAGLLFALLRRHWRPLPWWLFLLSVIPMGLDGLTQAPAALLPTWTLRSENHWAVVLSGGLFRPSFYVGDAIGHLNWWLRTITGFLFGLGLVWAVYPRVESEMRRSQKD
ncbi:MAG: DUF2085 domain-containing protein [Chloroflexia bacterium]|nr:DUF2085 domain-containing protein [Chloroflexia bacterium]